MNLKHTLLVSGLALLLGACSYPGGMGPGWGHRMSATSPMMMGGGPGGGYGYGGGMMGSPNAWAWDLEALDLSADQRARIAAIQDELHQRRWASMQAMHAESGPLPGWADEAPHRKRFEQMSAWRKQMFEDHLEARRRILELLTPAQRQRLTANTPRG